MNIRISLQKFVVAANVAVSHKKANIHCFVSFRQTCKLYGHTIFFRHHISQRIVSMKNDSTLMWHGDVLHGLIDDGSDYYFSL